MNSRTLPALTAAGLLGAALICVPSAAQEKTKSKVKPEAVEALAVDYSVSISNVDAVDSTISEDIIAAIFSGAISQYATELATLDATSITVPEIAISITSQRGSTENNALVTFTDLVLADVNDGVAGSVSLGGITMETGKSEADFGTMSANNFNIGQMLAVYGLVDTGRTEIETIYTDFVATGGTMTSDEVTCIFGGVNGAEFKARPLKTSFAEMITLAQAVEDDPDDLDPALIGKGVRMYADILTAFETSEVRFDGIACDGTDSDDRPMRFGLDQMVMGGMSPGIYPSLSMDGLIILVEDDGEMTLDNVTIKQADLTNLIATLESVPDDVDEAWFDANARRLIPAMEGMSFAGFSMDIPDPDDADTRIQASIDAFDLTLLDYLNAIPTNVDISAQGVRFALPEDSGDDGVEQLRALGITEINAAFRLAAAWDEATSSINFEEASFSADDLGSMNVTGTIANATAALFSINENAALMAAMGIAVKSVAASVEDTGISDLIVAIAAKEQGGDPTTLRPIYADLAKGTVIGMLAGVADAAKMGDAISAFVKGEAKVLEIGITAKDDPGLNMMDFIAAEDDPTSLLGKVSISAEAK